jgi:hypothetical protein
MHPDGCPNVTALLPPVDARVQSGRPRSWPQTHDRRSIDRFDLYPARLLGDSAYGSAEMLGWLVYEHGIEPHVTVFDKSTRQDGTFSRDDFTYDVSLRRASRRSGYRSGGRSQIRLLPIPRQ